MLPWGLAAPSADSVLAVEYAPAEKPPVSCLSDPKQSTLPRQHDRQNHGYTVPEKSHTYCAAGDQYALYA